MPQDEQMMDTLAKVADIAQELGRIEAIVRQFNTQVKGIEDRLSKLDENLSSYSKQLDRLGNQVQRIEAISKERTDLVEQIKEVTKILQAMDATTIEKTIKDTNKENQEIIAHFGKIRKKK